MTGFDRLDQVTARLAATSAIIGGMGLIFAVLVTCVSILMKLIRRALDMLWDPMVISENWGWVRPILGEEELVQYAVGLALFAALPWALYQRAHVQVDLFKPVLGQRFNRLLDLLGDIAFAFLAYLILTRQWYRIFRQPRRSQSSEWALLFSDDPLSFFDRLRVADESQILGIKLWQLYAVAELLVVAFFLVAVFCVVRSSRAFFFSFRNVS